MILYLQQPECTIPQGIIPSPAPGIETKPLDSMQFPPVTPESNGPNPPKNPLLSSPLHYILEGFTT